MNSLVQSWKRLTEDWERNIVRPIFVSALAAVVLVTGSLVFAPVRRFLFPPEVRADYPLLCAAEPIVEDASSGKLVVAFYVINKTGEEQTLEKLNEFLRGSGGSPTISLNYARTIGQVNPKSDSEFNGDKADFDVTLKDTTVHIVPRRISARGVARVAIEVTGLRGLEGITKSAHASIPLDRGLANYESACYTP